jgi:hypothetical protein
MEHRSSSTFMETEVSFLCHKNQPMDPILIQANPAHSFTPLFFKLQFNLIFPYMAMSHKFHLSFKYFNNILYIFLISFIYAVRPSHLMVLDFVSIVTSGVEYKLRSSSLCNNLRCFISYRINILIVQKQGNSKYCYVHTHCWATGR